LFPGTIALVSRLILQKMIKNSKDQYYGRKKALSMTMPSYVTGKSVKRNNKKYNKYFLQ
jgi:hypothetical protein